jgi:hypothetical protein
MSVKKKGHCKHCRDFMFCKIHEEGCNGNGEEMIDCTDYEESED